MIYLTQLNCEVMLMKKIEIDRLASRIKSLRQKVIEIKGKSVFDVVNSDIKQPKIRRIKDVKLLEK